jgi:outer membrane receptor protein involved in Fe transport
MNFKATLLTILISLNLCVIAQNRPNPDQKFNFTAKVMDGSNNAPLPYATIAIYSMRDSSLVDGGITNESGIINLQLKRGIYKIEFSFISYKSKTVRNVNMIKGDADIGVITLVQDAKNLDEVNIVAEKSQMEFKLDKKVFNVGSDPTMKGANASDILDNVPSVEVDVEGNVSLRGSQNVRILINGKPSGLVGTSTTAALRQLQGSMIERIEVITNPSSKYDAEGEAGIINIIMKEEKKSGINGSVEVRAGYPENFGASINLNMRREKFNAFVNYGTGYSKFNRVGKSEQQFSLADTNYSTNLDRDYENSGISHNIMLGTDFYLNDKNTLTISGLYRLSDEDNIGKITYLDYDQEGNLINESIRKSNEQEDDENKEVALSYKKTFDKKGKEFTADFKYNDGGETEKSDISEYAIRGADVNQPVLNQFSDNTENETNYLFQTDFTLPLSKGMKIETGAKANLRTIDTDYKVEEEDLFGNINTLSEFTNIFDYQEDVYAAYGILSKQYEKLSYQIGLRMEHSEIGTELKTTNQKNQKSYTDFFPSAAFTYKLKNENSLQWSYSRRISRPRFRSLNPFFTFSDARNIRTGNPDLNPEYTNSFEVGYLKYWKKASFYVGTYYKHTTDVTDQISFANDTGVTFTLPVNLSTQDDYGIETNFSKDLTTKLKVNGSVNVFISDQNGSYNGIDYGVYAFNWNARASAKYSLDKQTDFQINGMYRAPRKSSQGKVKSMTVVNLAASRDVLKSKGTLTFSVQDVLNTRKWRSYTETETFTSESEFQWRPRQFLVSFSYRFNQAKQRQKPSGYDGGGDDGGF